jgi:hypothetical protein
VSSDGGPGRRVPDFSAVAYACSRERVEHAFKLIR